MSRTDRLLVMLCGMGGIGKTSLAITLAQRIQNQFDYVIWRSLNYETLLEDLLEDLIKFLSARKETSLTISIRGKTSELLNYLKESRCLLILDDAESIMCEGADAGRFIKDYEMYGELYF